MIYITFGAAGEAISDFDAEWRAAQVVRRYRDALRERDGDATFFEHYSTANIIGEFRLLIQQGAIDCSEVTFTYHTYRFQANKYGAIPDWPEGFCDHSMHTAQKILRGALEMRRAEREEGRRA